MVPIGQSLWWYVGSETMCVKHSPEDIVKILHSINKLSVSDGELDTWFEFDEYPSGIRSFEHDSFTRKLLELIEDHLLENENEDPKS
jgi:hypothetical protein